MKNLYLFLLMFATIYSVAQTTTPYTHPQLPTFETPQPQLPTIVVPQPDIYNPMQQQRDIHQEMYSRQQAIHRQNQQLINESYEHVVSS
jgi:hypothetical protein